MAKTAANDPPQAEDTDRLKSDVKSFAAQLGFGSIPATGFDYEDFAPQNAKQKIKHAAPKQPETAKPKSKDQNKVPPAGVPKFRHNDKEQARQQSHAQSNNDPKTFKRPVDDDAIRERGWRESVGPRPGEAKAFGKSLIGKDEAVIWYEAASALGKLTVPEGAAGQDDDAAEVLRQKAEQLLEREAALFEKSLQRRNAGDARWLQQVRRAGTTADKVAAMSMLVQDSAVANLRSLDGLLTLMAKRSGGRSVVGPTMEALQELFRTCLLPDRKLKVLEQQPLEAVPPGKEGERYLVYWAIEDAIKQRYKQFVVLLEETSRDNLEHLKERATKAIATLLMAKPEAEAQLLTALVNKLGDPNRKVASKAGYLLGQLLLQHPVMKAVVASEVERFIFRPGLTDRAHYYAITFLNQMVLSHRDSEGGSALAQKLIDIYFSMFRLIMEGQMGKAATMKRQQQEKQRVLKKTGVKGGMKKARHGKPGRHGKHAKGGHKHHHHHDDQQQQSEAKVFDAEAAEMDARMLGALITGVRRAFPYVDAESLEPLVERHSEALFKLIHTAPFSTALQALMLLFQLLTGQNAVSDRFYRSLYTVMLTDGPRTGNKTAQFMSLLFKVIKADVSVKRAAAFCKRLMQAALHANSNWACGALLLLSEVLKSQPALWSAVQQPEEQDDNEEHFQDAPDSDAEGGAEPASATANTTKKPHPPHARNQPVQISADNDSSSDDEGINADVALGDADMDDDDDDDDDAGDNAREQQPSAGPHTVHDRVSASIHPTGHGGQAQQHNKAAFTSVSASAAARQHGSGPASTSSPGNWPREGYYDMRKREPLYANAERTCWWELTCLASHVHPSVAAFARALLFGTHIIYEGDPLRDLTLPGFLDKFVLKKPKSHSRGTSLMQPLSARLPPAAGATAAQVGSEAFAALAQAQVAPADMFFHKFYALKTSGPAKKKKKPSKADASDSEDMSSDEGGRDDMGDYDDVTDAAADRVLEAEEGVGDDELGNPEIGYDYDALLDAMADGFGNSGSGSDEDAAADNDGDDDQVVDDDDDDDDDDGDDGDDGDDEEADADDSDDDAGADDYDNRTDGSEESAGESSSSDDDDGDDDDEEFVMFDANATSHKRLKTGADVTDEELQDVKIFNLPSPSSSDGDDDDGATAKLAKRNAKRKQQQLHPDADVEPTGTAAKRKKLTAAAVDAATASGSDSDLDLDLDALLGGSEEEEDLLGDADLQEPISSHDTDEQQELRGKAKHKKRKLKEGGKKQAGLDVFAPAADYEHLFTEHENDEQPPAAQHNDRLMHHRRGALRQEPHDFGSRKQQPKPAQRQGWKASRH